MRILANIGPATFAGAALLLFAGKPAMAQVPNEVRCLYIEDTDRRVECLEGLQEGAQPTPAPLLPAPTSLLPPPTQHDPATPKQRVRDAAPKKPVRDAIPEQQSRERVSANLKCAKAKSAIQRAICADATLAEWDSRMSELYRQALAQQGKDKKLPAEQRQWLSQRDDKCKSAEAAELNSCVLEMTKSRLAELATAMATPEPVPVAAAADPEPPDPPKPTAAAREAKRDQAIRDKKPPKVQTAAKERDDFRRILRDDKEAKPGEPATGEQPQRSATGEGQRPYEIDTEKFESADAKLGYTTISSGDFFRDARDLVKSRKKIAIEGAYLNIGGDERFFDSRMTAMLARSGHTTDPGITLLTDQAPGDLRAYFSSCSVFAADIDISCSARIRGRVTSCSQSGSEGIPCLAVEGGEAQR